MKFKLVLITLFFSLFTFVSCKDESVEAPKLTVESAAIKSSLSVLKTHFNEDGSISRDGQNPTNNIIFDFCFDFVYPITLSYNTGTEVTVQGIDGLIDILVNMTDDLYINGIAFPFDVEIFNADTGAFEVLTINNEGAFMSLLETCSIDDSGQNDDCNCPEEYNPVCVAVQDPSGESFTVEFPNFCYAQCEGFTQNDVVECGNSNPATTDNLFGDCFGLIYPFSIINDNRETVEINDYYEFSIALYSNYNLEFVYPLNIEMENDGQTITLTINNDEELNNIIMQCDDSGNNGNDCDCDDTIAPVCVNDNGQTIEFNNPCLAFCAGYTQADFVECNPSGGNDCDCDDTVAPVCVDDNGQTIEFNNPCLAFCAGYTQADFVECNPSGGNDNCSITNLNVAVGDCTSTTTYNLTLNFVPTNYDGTDFTILYSDRTEETFALADLPLQLEISISGNPQTGWFTVSLPGSNCQQEITWEIPQCQ